MHLHQTLYFSSSSSRCHQDLERELLVRVRDAQQALRQATDANRQAALSMLSIALREFSDLVLRGNSERAEYACKR